MDTIIVRVARAVASHPRLHILSYLADHGEIMPTALAEKLNMTLPTLSIHLKALSTTGLVVSRKSGTNCYYSAASPYGSQTLSGQLSQWLRSILTTRRRVAKYDDESVHAAVFDAATAFTDLRRLQILRRLATQGEATVEQLRNELSISSDAMRRHSCKLRRRGYITCARTGDRSVAFTIVPTGKSPIHSRLFQIVQRAWQQG